MTATTRLLSIVLAAAALAGCADAHLGDAYGRRTRSALDAQASGKGEVNRSIDGQDAKLVLSRHRTATREQNDDGGRRTGAIIVPTLSTSGGSSSYTRDMPPPGSVRLDAVR